MTPIHLTWEEKNNTSWQRNAMNIAAPIIAVVLFAITLKRPLLDYKLMPLLVSGILAFLLVSRALKNHIHHEFSGDALGFRYTVTDMSKTQPQEVKTVEAIRYGLFLRQVDCKVEVPYRSVSGFEMSEDMKYLNVVYDESHRVDIRLHGLREKDVIALKSYFQEFPEINK